MAFASGSGTGLDRPLSALQKWGAVWNRPAIISYIVLTHRCFSSLGRTTGPPWAPNGHWRKTRHVRSRRPARNRSETWRWRLARRLLFADGRRPGRRPSPLSRYGDNGPATEGSKICLSAFANRGRFSRIRVMTHRPQRPRKPCRRSAASRPVVWARARGGSGGSSPKSAAPRS